jgi:hypothetical protein
MLGTIVPWPFRCSAQTLPRESNDVRDKTSPLMSTLLSSQLCCFVQDLSPRITSKSKVPLIKKLRPRANANAVRIAPRYSPPLSPVTVFFTVTYLEDKCPWMCNVGAGLRGPLHRKKNSVPRNATEHIGGGSQAADPALLVITFQFRPKFCPNSYAYFTTLVLLHCEGVTTSRRWPL